MRPEAQIRARLRRLCKRQRAEEPRAVSEDPEAALRQTTREAQIAILLWVLGGEVPSECREEEQ